MMKLLASFAIASDETQGMGRWLAERLRQALSGGGSGGRTLKGDVVAGLVVALLSLPMTIPLGVLALSPLGPDYTAAGVVAGFYSSVVAGLLSALLGGSRFQISGPRASVSLIMAAAIALALRDPRLAATGLPPEQVALSVGVVVVFLAGVVQVALGIGRVGQAVRYIPYPVLSGFLNGVGILIILGQLPAALGLPAGLPVAQVPGALAGASPAAFAVTLCTMAVMGLAKRWVKAVPPIVLAFAVGLMLDHLLRWALGGAALGPLVGAISGELPRPTPLLQVLALPWHGDLLGVLVKEMPMVFVLAMVGSMESLLSAVALDDFTGTHHDSNRELVGQGLGNMVGACFGAVASTGAPLRGVASYRAGGRTRLAGVLHSLFLLAALLWGTSVLGALPYSVMAGIMSMIALSMLDAWGFKVFRRGGRDFLLDALVVVVVAGITVFDNLATAVLVGLGIAILQFVRTMSRPIAGRAFDRTASRSRRVRPLQVEESFKLLGKRIVVTELDGPLFFGTCESLRQKVEALPTGAGQFLIIDLRRVGHIDLSGARILQQIGARLAARGCRVLLSGLGHSPRRRRWLVKSGVAQTIPPSQWLQSLDRALEMAEDSVLAEGSAAAARELAVEELDVVDAFSQADVDHLKGVLRRRVYDPDSIIFRKEQACDGLYLLVSGFIEVRLPPTEHHAPVRLATFGPGTILGELALLDGGTRSADAVADGPAVAYHLPLDAFHALRSTNPVAATQLLMNVGRQLVDRLRLTNARLQAME